MFQYKIRTVKVVPGQKIQPVGTFEIWVARLFQYHRRRRKKRRCAAPQQDHPSPARAVPPAVSRDVPVQNIQSVRMFQYKVQKHSVSKDVPVQNIQSVRMFQYKVQKYSVIKDVPVQNIQSGT
jgi:hypothetical protein